MGVFVIVGGGSCRRGNGGVGCPAMEVRSRI